MTLVTLETPQTSQQSVFEYLQIAKEHVVSHVSDLKNTLMQAAGNTINKAFDYTRRTIAYLKGRIPNCIIRFHDDEKGITELETTILTLIGTVALLTTLALVCGHGIDVFSDIDATRIAAHATASSPIVETLAKCGITDYQLQGSTTFEVPKPYDTAGLEVRRCPGGPNNDLLRILPSMASATFRKSVFTSTEGTWGVVNLDNLPDGAIKLNGIPAGSVGFVSLSP